MRPNALNSTVLPSLALDSGTPCRNDEAGVGSLQHLEFIHYRGFYKDTETMREIAFDEGQLTARSDLAEGLTS